MPNFIYFWALTKFRIVSPNSIHYFMVHLQKALLIAASIAFISVIGAAIYEHLSIVPVWKRSPPQSLAMFNGPYAITPERFWKLIHPVCLLLTIGALIACWRTGSRPAIAILLAGYAVVLGITAIYFVPELLSITRTPWSDTVSADLTRRSQIWEMWSLVRLAFLVVLAAVLLSGFFRLEQPYARAQQRDVQPAHARSAAPGGVLHETGA